MTSPVKGECQDFLEAITMNDELLPTGYRAQNG